MDHENVTNTAALPQAFVKNWGLTKRKPLELVKICG